MEENVKKTSNIKTLLPQIFTGIIVYAAVISFYGAWFLKEDTALFLITCAVGVAFATGLHNIARKKFGISIAGMVLLCLILYKWMANGAAASYNSLSYKLGEIFGYNYKQLVVETGSETFSKIVFVLFPTIIVSSLLFLCVKTTKWWRLIIFQLIVAALGFIPVFIGLNNLGITQGVIIAGMIIFMAYETEEEQKVHLVVYVVAGLMGIIVACAPYMTKNRTYTKSSFISMLENMIYESDQSPMGDVSKAAYIKHKDTVLFNISLSKATNIHLKGFVGSEYTASGEYGIWKSLENSSYAGEYIEMMDWLEQEGYEPLSGVATYEEKKASYKGEDTSYIQVSVSEDFLKGRYYYTPVSLIKADLEKFDTKFRDENIKHSWFDDTSSYEYSVYDISEEDLILEDAEEFLMEHAENDEILGPYHKAEYNYRRFAYDKYLDIPESEAKNLADKYDIDISEDTKLSTKVQKVRDVLKEDSSIEYSGLIESETDNDSNNDLDNVTKTTAKSFAYASKATLLFRLLGVPARYVEGYYIQQNQGTKVSVTDKYLHGWVEIYSDGIGWINVEVTPGYYEDIEEDEQQQNDQNQNNDNEKDDNQSYNPEDGTKNTSICGIFFVILIVIIIVIFTIFVVLLLRHVILWNSKNDQVRYGYYKKRLSRLLNKKGMKEKDMPAELWNVLQAHTFGGVKPTTEEIEMLKETIIDLKKRRVKDV